MATTANLRISLEPHLVESLTPLQAILPTELAEQVAQSLSATTILYDTLIEISKWSRSEPGKKALEAHSLSPGDYNTISLLAGATTAPDGKFGDYIPPPDPATVEKHKTRERKAITTLVNGVFSVLGVGFAAWWATARTGWIDEWVSQVPHHLNLAEFLNFPARLIFVLCRYCRGNRRGRNVSHLANTKR